MYFDPQSLLAPRWPLMILAVVLMVLLLLPRSGRTGFDFLRESFIVVPGYLLYSLVRGLVHGRESEAFARATDVIHLEQTLGIFWEFNLQRFLMQQEALVNLANWTYTWAHWPLILSTAVWLFLFHRGVYPVYRNAFLISGAIALIVYATVPVAPPRFMGAWGFVDTVATATELQSFQPPAFVNQYAAMPSLHVGWSMLVGVALVRHGTGAFPRVLGVVAPVAMFLSVISTGNHYIMDGIAGAAVAALALLAAQRLTGVLERRGGPGPIGRFPASARPAT